MIEILGAPSAADSAIARRLFAAAQRAGIADLVVAFPGSGIIPTEAWARLIAADRPADDRPALVHLGGELRGIRGWAAALQADPLNPPDPPIWPWERHEPSIDGPVRLAEERERALAWWLEARVRRGSESPWPLVRRPWPRHAWAVVHRAPLTEREIAAILEIVGEQSIGT